MHDDENCRYITKNGIITLTYRENFLLRRLLENKGKLIKCTYKDMYDLRKKLKGEVEIKSKRSRGYYIDY